MRRDRLVSAALIVAVAIVACVGSLKLSSTQQAATAITDTCAVQNNCDFGSVPVGMTSPTMFQFTVQPQSGTNHDTVTAILCNGGPCATQCPA